MCLTVYSYCGPECAEVWCGPTEDQAVTAGTLLNHCFVSYGPLGSRQICGWHKFKWVQGGVLLCKILEHKILISWQPLIATLSVFSMPMACPDPTLIVPQIAFLYCLTCSGRGSGGYWHTPIAGI